jgi:hypothetical protein
MLDIPLVFAAYYSLVQSGLSKMETREPRELRETLGAAVARTASVANMRVLIILMRVSSVRKGVVDTLRGGFASDGLRLNLIFAHPLSLYDIGEGSADRGLMIVEKDSRL